MSRQFGLTCEILSEYLKKDHKIYFLRCNGALQSCFGNPIKNPIACAACQSREDHFLRYLGIPIYSQFRITRNTSREYLNLPPFQSLDDIIKYEYKNVDIGRAVASSAISYTRDYDLLQEKYSELIRREFIKSMDVLDFVLELFSGTQFDEIILFNGRFSEVYPVFKLAMLRSIPIKTIESGSGEKYEYFENSLPHSIMTRQLEIEQTWRNGGSSKSSISHNWFKDKRDGVSKTEINYTSVQQKSCLPVLFDPAKKNIVIFNSSEDEVKTIDEWDFKVYKNQNDAIEKIVTHFQKQSEYHFYLRVHPNLSDVDNAQMKEIREMGFQNMTILYPSDPVDTYALMEAADAVLTFGSTMGIEATYWGKVSILFGNAYFQNMDCAYEPISYDELFKLIKSVTKLKAKPRENTLPYAYYFSVYGIQPVRFHHGGILNSTFDGKRMLPVYPSFSYRIFPFLIRHFIEWKSGIHLLKGKTLNIGDIFTYK